MTVCHFEIENLSRKELLYILLILSFNFNNSWPINLSAYFPRPELLKSRTLAAALVLFMVCLGSLIEEA